METRVIRDDEALVEVCWKEGQQTGTLRDPVRWDATRDEVLTWAAEALQAGDVPNLPAVPDAINVLRRHYVADPNARNPAVGNLTNVWMIRPKVPFGF